MNSKSLRTIRVMLTMTAWLWMSAVPSRAGPPLPPMNPPPQPPAEAERSPVQKPDEQGTPSSVPVHVTAQAPAQVPVPKQPKQEQARPAPAQNAKPPSPGPGDAAAGAQSRAPSANAKASVERAQPAPATKRDGPEAEIVLTDRRRITGKLIESTPTRVVLEIGGVLTSFPVEQVEAVRQLASVQARYDQLRLAIGDQDVEGMLRLAEWCRARNRVDLSMVEVDRALKLEPFNQQAKELKTILTAQLEVLRAQQAAQESSKAAARAGATQKDIDAIEAPLRATTKPKDRFDPNAFPLLSPDEINLIRVFEADLKNPPAIVIRRATLERFLDEYGGTIVEGKGTVPIGPEARERFFRMKPAEQLDWFFAVRARAYYGEVDVLDSPRSMKTWRDRVHGTWVANSCATSRCHGGEEAGRLFLTNRRPGSEDAAYTNFLIIERFRTKSGLPLIDYKEPSRSVLLQAGLPQDQAAAFKHPDVSGLGRRWAPIFESQNDPRYRQAVDWIRSMFPNRSEYPIEYEPPAARKMEEDAPETDAKQLPPAR